MPVIFDRGTNNQSAEEYFRRGLDHAIKHPKGAIALFKKAAASGHSGALLNLGSFYRDGHGVLPNWKRAQLYFERAASAGNREGMTSLARMLLERGRTSASSRRALQLLKQALRKGDLTALHFLGRAAEDQGQWTEAEQWYRKALNKGDLTSGMRIAHHYLNKLSFSSQARGVKALRMAISKSEINSAWACTEIAKCYLHGRGVPKSKSHAVRFLRRAANTDPEAQHLLKSLALKQK